MNLLSWLPFKTGVVIGLLCYVVVENPPFKVRWPSAKDLSDDKVEFFPLSSFPMYASFSSEPFYVFLTDEKDQPIRISDLGIPSSPIKKDYEKKLDALKKDRKIRGKLMDLPLPVKQEAGQGTLENLMTNRAKSWFAANPEKHVRMYEVIIRAKGGGGAVDEQKTLVAEGALADAGKKSTPQNHGASQ